MEHEKIDLGIAFSLGNIIDKALGSVLDKFSAKYKRPATIPEIIVGFLYCINSLHSAHAGKKQGLNNTINMLNTFAYEIQAYTIEKESKENGKK